jgi:LPS-assembly lipoprotein
MTAPLDLIIVTKDAHSPLMIALRQSLRNYKINEVTAATTNTLTLDVSRELLDKRTAGVGSDALTSAYEIIMRVDFSVSNDQGVITPIDTSARTSRTYDYNVNNANSAAQEEELVLREMRREIANTILRRVKNLSVKSAPTSPTAAP